ncbi:MAG: hypothetical protein R2708_28405 [Vicinamibacterales bacterium]
MGGRTRVRVTQQRFVGTPGAARVAPQAWTLPVCVTTAAAPPPARSSRRRESFDAPGCGAAFVNADARGYYFDGIRTGGADRAGHLRTAAADGGRADQPARRTSGARMRAGRHDIGAYLDLARAFATDDTPAVLNDLVARIASSAALSRCRLNRRRSPPGSGPPSCRRSTRS